MLYFRTTALVIAVTHHPMKVLFLRPLAKKAVPLCLELFVIFTLQKLARQHHFSSAAEPSVHINSLLSLKNKYATALL